ncbi:MAG TPA: S8 family serine peptidase [Jatrophihabitantaceae bacterium]|jgi:subtilisin family serine protease
MRHLALVLALAGAVLVAPAAAPATAAPAQVEVIVVLKSQANVAGVHAPTRVSRLAGVERLLRSHAAQAQRGVLALLARRGASVSSVTPLWIANAVEVTATPAVIRELAARPDVATVAANSTIQAPAASAMTTTAEPNLAVVNAPAMWDRGYRGQGVVVASMDTGVDATHPDLSAAWRGGANSWYDPNGQHPTTPTDVNGHGTQTMGVMVGGAAGGSSVGLAPDAKWIAVKIFNDRGQATTAGIHQGFQWLLDPDGNPSTADAPNVVNDSWTMSTAACVLDFQLDLRSLRAAGILPVFAAGNNGPLAGTVQSPANLPEAFAVGGTDNSDAVYPYSSRGPSTCAGATAPQVVAPATDIRTSDLYGDYAVETGTSIAAPHVSGALALLLGAFPHLTADQQQVALGGSAVDLGAAGLDSDFGYGRLDVLAAYQRLASTPDYTVTVSPPSATVVPGGSTSYDVAVSGVNGFAGDVALAVGGIPANASAAISPAVVSGGSGTAQLSVTTNASIAPGSYPLTITATSGALAHTAIATLVVPAPPDFGLAATPSSQSVVAGGSSGYDVTVDARNGFTGDVALTLSGLPPSVGTASFAPATVTAAGPSRLTITTSAAALTGTYSLTITGASGSTMHTSSVTLVIAPPPDFSLAASPASRTVNAGGTGTYTITVGAVNGFTATVNLSLGGLPGSVGTATFTPSGITGSGTSQLAVKTPAGAPAGSYPLTITATSGALSHATSVTLTVPPRDFTVAASPASVTVTRGQTASYAVSVASLGGFAGGVTLSVTGLPSGATASWTANPVTAPGSSTLRVRTTTSTVRGTFTLRVTGKNGTLTHQATVTLIVR